MNNRYHTIDQIPKTSPSQTEMAYGDKTTLDDTSQLAFPPPAHSHVFIFQWTTQPVGRSYLAST